MTLTTRRVFLGAALAIAAAGPALARTRFDESDLFAHPGIVPWGEEAEDFSALTEDDWRARLTPDQFRILRQEGTERAGSSPLDDETREGIFVCAGCALPLFSSRTKYDSRTGWPSFWAPLENAVNTKPDRRLWTPRTEYHCARCGGHQGHVFDDGPRPTGQRWCNNGLALNFVARPQGA
ncbi:peptide-methionine (R)-S-oxide reductase MsrB [Hyphomonadaceae bacterium ML37]|nr:peptide-methionine (R)-S-oxide reductase MsrB [Hyphomonadaceae bacterium ML37]